MTDIPTRDQIKPGTKVGIETKENQGTGKLTKGIIKNILTSSNIHPHGIKVELEDGQIGRVKELFSNNGNVITTRSYEIEGPGDEDYESGMKITINEEPSSDKFSNIDTSIPKNENEYNEFKSTFQYDLDEEKLRKAGKIEAADARKNNNKNLKYNIQKEVALTIAAFANQEGGRLFIGVNDDATILGLGRDLKTCGGTLDKLQSTIRDALKKFLQNYSFIAKLKFEFGEDIDKQYLVIHVPRATEAIFVHTSSGQEPYVRMQNSSEKFTYDEFLKHCKDRF